MSLAQFLATQVWFNFSAVMPIIEQEWGLSSIESGIIIAAFQGGYVIAVLFHSFLIDRFNPKFSFIIGATIAGSAGILFTMFAQGFWSTFILRTISGIGLAGLYVPGIRILSSLFPSKERGRALGIYVGSLVFGSGFSLLVSGLFIESIGWKGVVFTTSSFCYIAVLLMIFLPITTIHKPQRSLMIGWDNLKKAFSKPNLFVYGGYAGHSWELYAMWAWIGPFLVFYFTFQGFEQADAIRYGNVAGAFVIMSGGFATYIGGRLSDKVGRIKAINLFLIISISCSIVIGWLSWLPLIFMLILVILYGFSIVADSPAYNACITEVCSPEVIGLSIGIQSVIGYSVTILSPIVFGTVLSSYGWGMAFTVIGVGTLVAPMCTMLLSKLQRTQPFRFK